MQGARKIVVGLAGLLCFYCAKLVAQPMQLPSLFDEPEAQNEYQRNAVLRPGEDAEAKIHSLIFIKTSVSKQSCYVGEPLLITYQLYTAVSCHSRVTKQVAFSGCSVIEMTSDEPEQTVREKGVIYRVQLIRKVQLIPLQSGNLVIPPATVNNDVSFSTVENPYAQKRYSVDISSEPYNVQITALPEPQPDDFSGITGSFNISARVDSTAIAAGENNRLLVTINGAGNIEAITEPQINWPKHSEHFDPADSQHINRMNFPESGDKTFIFPFLITKKGRATLPRVSFTYFNTELKKYETVSTHEIPLLIRAAIKRTNPAALVANDLSNAKYLWFVPAIAAVVILVWLLMNRTSKKTNHIEISAVKKEREAPAVIAEPETVHPDYNLLLTALNEAEDNRTFFTNAKILLLGALQYKLSPKQDDEVILMNLLRSKSGPLAERAEAIVSLCNRSLYSPVEDEATRTKMIEQLSELINELETI